MAAAAGDHHYDNEHSEDGRGKDGTGMASRSCTDIFCALLFFVFLGGMGYVSNHGVKHGNPKRLTHGFDYNGRLCGVDADVLTKPLLYYCPTVAPVAGIPTGLNLKAPVCVDHCPTDANETFQCVQRTSGSVSVKGSAAYASQTVVLKQSIVAITSYPTTEVLGLYCIPDLKKLNAIATASGVPVPAGLRDSLFNATGPIGKNSVKMQQYIGSLRRCSTLLFGSMAVAVILGYAYLLLLRVCAKPLIYVVLLSLVLSCFALSGFFLIGEVMPRPGPLSGDSTIAPPPSITGTTMAPATPAPPVPVALAPAAPVTVAPVAVAPVAVAPVAAVPAVTAATAAPVVVLPAASPTAPAPRRLASVATPLQAQRRLMSYEDACLRVPAACDQLDKRWNAYGGRKKWEELNPFYSEHMSLEDAKKASLVTGCIFASLGLIFLLLVCCAHDAINTAVGCVEAACEAIFSMPCLLFMPAIEMAIKAILMGVLFVFLAFLVSSGEMDTKTYANIGGEEVNGLRRHFKYEKQTQGFLAFYVFGMLWILELANAMGSFVISFAVVGWYYTPKPKGHNWCGIVWGYVYALTFHLGTLAFGSLMIAILRYIRLILMVVERTSKSQGNPVVACIAKALICCITCFKKFFEMINKNAYIDVCITSNNFCGAAHDVMAFIGGHPAEIAILNGACTIFSFAGMSIISGLTGYITYMLCTSQKRWTDETSIHHVSSPRFVSIVAAVAALFIGHAFMQIFDHTADTLLYTYCWNKSKAHNTVQKYAPDSLTRLVNYKPLSKPKGEASPGKTESSDGGGFFSSLFGTGHSVQKDSGHSSERKPLMSGDPHH